jgi:hypothetical protein
MGTFAKPLNVHGRHHEPGDAGGRISEQIDSPKMPACCGGSRLLEHQRGVCNQAGTICRPAKVLLEYK